MLCNDGTKYIHSRRAVHGDEISRFVSIEHAVRSILEPAVACRQRKRSDDQRANV